MITMIETKTGLEVHLEKRGMIFTMGKPFDKLANKVTKEYEKKGYSEKRSKEIGKETAGKISRIKHLY